MCFTNDEMKLLWCHYKEYNHVDMILIQCYSGWRPRELVALKLSDIDLKKRAMTGGMKTNYGINRTVPIHPRIYPLIKNYYDRAKEVGSEYLFNHVNQDPAKNRYVPMTYKRFFLTYDLAVKELHLDERHRPHDGRKQFVTMAKRYNLDEYAIKRLVGHSIADLTERVYTERDFEWLRAELEKIK